MTQLPTVPCSKCGRQIAWVRTETNQKGMPIDPDPNPAGNVSVRYEAGKLTAHVFLRSEKRPSGTTVFMPHFATCPAQNKSRPDKPVKPPAAPKPEQGSLL